MSFKIVSPAEFQESWGRGVRPLVLDVRTPVEYQAAHAPMAELLPLGELSDGVIASRKLASTPVALLCKSGGRARKAAEKLASAGATEVFVIDGGTDGWIAAGLPVTRGEVRGLSLQRQTHLGVGLLVLSTSLLALFVDQRLAILPALFGCGLTFAGATGWCGFAIMLSHMPWNKTPRSSCSVQ